jgi:hypothetical protein
MTPRDGATPGTQLRVDRKRSNLTRGLRQSTGLDLDHVQPYEVTDANDHDDPNVRSAIGDWLHAVGRYGHAVTVAAKADDHFSAVAHEFHFDRTGRDDVLRACASHLSTLSDVRTAKADVTDTALTITTLIAGKVVADFVRAALIGGRS